MIRRLIALAAALTVPALASVDKPEVRIEAPQLQGSRPLEKRTEASVIKDYLESWGALQGAMDQNQPTLLDAYFIGTAKDKLAGTIDEQNKMAVHTRYTEHSHDLQIVFYSPEGQSIQLIDKVEYEEQLMDHEKVLATKKMKTRYLVVMTPSEVRWRVRILQADTNP